MSLRSRPTIALATALCGPLLACTPTGTGDAGPVDAGQEDLINPTDAGHGDDDGGMPPVNTGGCPSDGPFIAHTDVGGGVTETVVTACSDARWVGLDLESRAETLIAEPPPADGWDLAFQRFHVMSNGGVSGTGGVRIAPLTGVAFDDVTEPPADGWREDQSDSDLDGYDDFVISGQDPSWWEYDIETHVISMTGVIWVVETVEGNHYKLELTDYYADVGGSAESGYPTFRWAPLSGDADAGPDDAGVDDDAGPGGDAGAEGDAGT